MYKHVGNGYPINRKSHRNRKFKKSTAKSYISNSYQGNSNFHRHRILYILLKSFDLDLKMGYKLGSVMGYGYK